ncbi:MAG: SLBB domain-containing protein [Verrucomicrobia bacterium]|jgi:polysaccharide export outer membrane protein|nr:SLBB domain-containing protein [Verrucomicrobiota bacterium]
MKNIVNMIMGRWKAGLAGLAAVCIVSGCQTTSPEGSFVDPGVSNTPPVAAPTPTPAPVTEEGTTEMLRPGDSIVVTFSDLPTPTAPFEERIKPDGTITLLHNKTFTAAGKLRGVLEKEIRACYVPNLYVNLTVTVKQQESTRFYSVGGEVRSPGRQVYISRLTVIKALQSAGDFTDFAKKNKVQLTRVDGRTFIVDVTKALKNPKLDLEVYPGDTIHVERKIW